MAAKSSLMQPLGSAAPDFDLPDTDGKAVCLADLERADALLVAFICNHCPFVVHLRDAFAAFAAEYATRGLATVAICANDAETYPADSPTRMKEFARAAGFVFPYLYDQSQQVALAYGAICTPDFFLYDRERRLAYRGQFDDSRPGNGKPVTGADLRAAADALLAGDRPAAEQRPSVGCSIKWRAGNEPEYA